MNVLSTDQHSMFSPILHLAVASRNNNRQQKVDQQAIEFDQFGGLPQLENTFRAISKASTIVALRTSNATVLSYLVPKVSNLQIPIGCQPLNILMNRWQYLLLTGLAADVRSVVHYVRQIALNHTITFDTAPSGSFIANEIGKYLHDFTVSAGSRPLAVHVFIADGLVEKSLYEVDSAGNVAQIWAGVAGSLGTKGREYLSGHLNGTAVYSVDVAQKMSQHILTNININQQTFLFMNDTTTDSTIIDGDGVKSDIPINVSGITQTQPTLDKQTFNVDENKNNSISSTPVHFIIYDHNINI